MTTTCQHARRTRGWDSLRSGSSRRFTFEGLPGVAGSALHRTVDHAVGCDGETLAAPKPADGSTPSPCVTTPERTNVTVVMNGDLLWHNTLWYGAEDARRRGHGGYDFAPLLAGMKPVIASADMAICHEEVPLARRGGPYRNFPLFAAPPHVVGAISATGYDVCTTASNHSVDQGFAGLKRTSMILIGPRSRMWARLVPRPNPSGRRSSPPSRASRSASSRPPLA